MNSGWTRSLLLLSLGLGACQNSDAKRTPCLTVPPPRTLTQGELQAIEESKQLEAFLDYVSRLKEWSQAAWVACGQEPTGQEPSSVIPAGTAGNNPGSTGGTGTRDDGSGSGSGSASP